MRQTLEKMTPEQRQEYWRNFQKWMAMQPADKKEMSEREESRRNKIREEINNAIASTGLELSEEQKQQFKQRYFEERRAIEEKLRKDYEEKRAPLLKEMLERLKAEFAKPATP
jgi:hypothetical protein